MEVQFLYLQSGKENWLEEAKSLYQKKIGHHLNFSVAAIKTKSLSRAKKNEKIKIEQNLIFKKIKDSDFLIIFDEKGPANLSSIEFSKVLTKVFDSGKQKVVFLIGGSYGFSDSVKARANKTFSLSKLTMNHHVALLMALEQIYRSVCIQKNIPYHNE